MIKIIREANQYVVYNGDEQLASYDCSRLGDQVAKELAGAYKQGWEDGWDAGETDVYLEIVKEHTDTNE